jgi:outer membrane autotransporter protein
MLSLAAMGGRRATSRALTTVVAAGFLLSPIMAEAHTDSLGYIITPGSTSGTYNSEIVYGSWHSNNINAEGSLNLYQNGTLLGNQVFAMLLGPVTNGTVPAGLIAGTNYFFADGNDLSSDPTLHDIYNFQSVTFSNLTPGTYTFGYASTTGLSANWEPSGAAIGAGTFVLLANGGVSVPGTSTNIDTAQGSYNSSQLGSDVNPVFAGGTLAIDETGETYANNFTLDNSGTNTVDATGNTTILSGAFTDADTTQPGGIAFQDSVGGGSVTLAGVNTQTGGTTLNSGTLALTGAGTLGAASNVTTVNGGVLDLGGTSQVQAALNQSNGVIANGVVAVDSFNLTGGLVATDAMIDAATAFNLTEGQVEGTLTGAGTLNKSGASTVILAGVNTQTGGTTLEAGTLALTGAGTLGAASNTTAVNGGVLDLGGTSQVQAALNQSNGVIANGSVAVDSFNLTGGLVATDATIDAATAFNLTAGRVDGTLTGTGTLNKNGTGTVILAGVNTQTGGTTLEAGTLALTGAGTLGAASNTTAVNAGILDLGGTSQVQAVLNQSNGVIANGSVAVDSYNLTGGLVATDATIDAATAFNLTAGQVDGTLTGTGTLNKTGAGTVVLAGVNTYGGGTTISDGTLQIGNGSNTGSITGNVVNNGTLALNRSDDVSFSGVVSGTGSVAQRGQGSTRLGNNNSYTGGTSVDGGTLIGSASSFGTGAILNNAALVIDQTSDANLVNSVGGTGSLTKIGTGALNLTGDSGLSGPTTLRQGRLAVNARFANSAFTAENGTTISGSGTVGGLVVQNGATLATGNAGINGGIGTLNVAGNVEQQAGSIYQVQLAASGVNDSLVASGSVAIANGAQLNVTHINGQRYALNTAYTIVSAAGGVTGRYTLTGDTSISAFVDLAASYGNPNAVVLRAAQARRFNSLSNLLPNQNAVANAAQSLPTTNPLFAAIAFLGTDAEARSAFTQLSGELHSSAKASMLEDSRFVREAVNLRLRGSTGGLTNDAAQDGAAEPIREGGISLWGHGFGSWGHIEGQEGNTSKLNRSIGGLFVGADAALGEDWRLGALGGYSRSKIRVNGRSSSGETDNYHVGAYVGGQAGPVALRLGGAYTWHKLDTSRSVAFTGFADSLDANYKAQTAQAFGELSHRFDVHAGAWEPFAQLAYVHLHTKAFTEQGGAAALTGRAENTNVTFSTLGLRAIKDLSADGATSLYGSMGWRRAFGDRTPLSNLRFVAGGDAFAVTGTPIVKNAAVFEAGINRSVATGLNIAVAYSGQISNRLQDHGFKAVLGIKF